MARTKFAPDEGSLSAETDPSPVTNALRAHSCHPLPQGERARKRLALASPECRPGSEAGTDRTTPPETPARFRNISAAPVRTSDGWRPGSSRSLNPAHAPPARASTCGSVPLVLAPPMNSVGVLIASASRFGERRAVDRAICPISVMALSRNSCFGVAGRRFQAPGPSSASMNSARPPSISPVAIISADAAIRAASGEGPGLEGRIERGIEFAAGLGQDQLAATDRAAAAPPGTKCGRRANAPSDRPARCPVSR